MFINPNSLIYKVKSANYFTDFSINIPKIINTSPIKVVINIHPK